MSTSSPRNEISWAGGSGETRLESWKDIASYFKRDVRTIQRWEKSLGLPIHRFQNSRSGPVFAYKSELEAWLVERTKQLDAVFATKESPESNATILIEGDRTAQSVPSHEFLDSGPPTQRAEDYKEYANDAGHTPSLNDLNPEYFDVLEPREASDRQASAAINPWPPAARVSEIASAKRLLVKRTAVFAVLVLAALTIGLFISKSRWATKKRAFRQVTTTASENRVTTAALDGDGKRLVFADAQGALHLRDLSSGYNQTLCTIPDAHLSRIAWFPDGSRVLLSGFLKTTQQFSVWVYSFSNRQLKMLRSGATQAAPSPDGKEIVFLQAVGSEIWIMNSDGSVSQRVVADSNANAFQTVTWSADSRRLSYIRTHIIPRRDPGGDLNMDMADTESFYETADAFSGKLLGVQPSNGLSLPFALDGGLVYFVRNDSSSHDLVEMKTDPVTGRFTGEPRSIVPLKGDEMPEVLNVTKDGRHIAAVFNKSRQSDVYVGEIEPGTMSLAHVQRLTLNTTQDFPHAWMPDSLSVLFESDRSGDWQIFKQQTGESDGEPVALGSKWDVMPQVSPDGKWILYMHNPRYVPASGRTASKRLWTLMRVPVTGGQPQEVPGQEAVEEYRCAGPGGKRCVLRSVENGQFVFYDLDPVRGRGRELTRVTARRNIFGDWGLSPDGSFVAIPDHDVPRCLFRVVDLDHAEQHEIELVVDAAPALTAVSWAVGRQGWFVSTPLSAGVELRYVDEKGHSSRVWESAVPTWPIASPDGRRLAFVDGSVDSNVWLLDQ